MRASVSDLLLSIDIFAAGAVVMALEIMGSRILAPYFGNSVYVWGSLIGVVLTFLSMGYYLGVGLRTWVRVSKGFPSSSLLREYSFSPCPL